MWILLLVVSEQENVFINDSLRPVTLVSSTRPMHQMLTQVFIFLALIYSLVSIVRLINHSFSYTSIEKESLNS